MRFVFSQYLHGTGKKVPFGSCNIDIIRDVMIISDGQLSPSTTNYIEGIVLQFCRNHKFNPDDFKVIEVAKKSDGNLYYMLIDDASTHPKFTQITKEEYEDIINYERRNYEYPPIEKLKS